MSSQAPTIARLPVARSDTRNTDDVVVSVGLSALRACRIKETSVGSPPRALTSSSVSVYQSCVAVTRGIDAVIVVREFIGLHRVRARESNAERVGVRHTGNGRGRQWCDCLGGLVEPDVLVELARQLGFEVVTEKLCLRTVDHTDRALESPSG